MLKSFREIRV